MTHPTPFIAATIQASPEFLDTAKTLTKLEELTHQAAKLDASLVVFPEAFLAGFPYWIWNQVNTSEQEAFRALWESAIDIPGPEIDQIEKIAKSANCVLVVGVNERDSTHGRATLYNSMLTFDSNGELVRRHRKLVPTYRERTIWGAGDGSGLTVADTSAGGIGGLICWENYMPLSRFHQYAQGAQIYVAVTVDERPQWVDLMKAIAAEGRVYVISSCQCLDPELVSHHPYLEGFPQGGESSRSGTSVVVDPNGEVIAGPNPGQDVILTAEVDPGKVIEGKHSLDVTGHYSRPDIFQLSVDTHLRAPFTQR